MATISLIQDAATAVGITAILTNSDAKLQTQLNRITDLAELPIMLVSWDLTTRLEFDDNGFLLNPTTPVTCLLMSKPDSSEKKERETTAESMGNLFTSFIVQLRSDLVQYNRSTTVKMLTNIDYQLVPKHGMGHHSGIIGKFTMKSGLDNC